MKKLLPYIFLVLMWCNVGFADAKSNECLAIEDICIGDSALDFFTEQQIKNNTMNYYKDKTYTPVQNDAFSFFNAIFSL